MIHLLLVFDLALWGLLGLAVVLLMILILDGLR